MRIMYAACIVVCMKDFPAEKLSFAIPAEKVPFRSVPNKIEYISAPYIYIYLYVNAFPALSPMSNAA